MLELLVVIALIALLAGLLLPALAQAKSSGQSAACKNNLKQLQLAWELYTGDHEGRIVYNRTGMPYGYWQSIEGWVLAMRNVTVQPLA